jgi:hypothetical protein
MDAAEHWASVSFSVLFLAHQDMGRELMLAAENEGRRQGSIERLAAHWTH